MHSSVSRSLVVAALVVFFSIQASATTRLHRGPRSTRNEKLLKGRTATLTETEDAASRIIASAPVRRIVDFTLHLRRDVLLYDELKKDGLRLSKCRMYYDARTDRYARSSFSVTGSRLDKSDFAVGAVFIVDESNFEPCLRREVPRIRNIDPDDSQMFLRIERFREVRAGAANLVTVFMPGKEVVPTVDINVHERPEPRAVATMLSDVEYADEPHSD